MIAKTLIFSFFLVVLFFLSGKAQLSGIVFDQLSRKHLAQVEITNLNNLEKTTSNDKGEFSIKATTNEVLVLRRAGYQSDTILLTQLKPIRRYLVMDRNTLSTVTISGKRTLREEYAQEFNKANPILFAQGRGLLFYPSGFFSKEGKQARHFVRLLKREEKEKVIDRKFNLKLISSILPIKQPELDAFYLKYKPSLKFSKKASEDDVKSYVVDCYQKFKLLPSSQKILPSLK